VLKVKLVKSRIGCSPVQRKTLDALGLRKIRAERSFEESPSLLGMVEKVKHMVEVARS
jgi:large subunit ribosomal protein L30